MHRENPSPYSPGRRTIFFVLLMMDSSRYYNADNWKKQAKNYYGDHKAKMFLCAHPTKTVLDGLTKLVSPTSAVR